MLEPLFSDRPRPRNTVVATVVGFPFYLFVFNKGWLSGKISSLHNDIFSLRYIPFLPQLYLEGLLYSPPMRVSTVSAGTAVFDPFRGPRSTVVVVVVVFSLLPIPFY